MTNITTRPAPAGYPEAIAVETDGSLLEGLSGAAFSADRPYRYVQAAPRAVAAWGAHGELRGRAAEVTRMLAAIPGVRLECLGVTKDGHPKHPLARGRERIPDDTPLVPWEPPS